MAEETVEQEVVQEEVQQPIAEQTQETETPVAQPADDGVIKVDLRDINEKTNATEEQSTNEVPLRDKSETIGEVQKQDDEKADEEPSGESSPDDTSNAVLELIQEEEINEEEKTLADKVKDIPNKLKEQAEDVNNNQEANELPENIGKLVDFMKETGGSLQDYVNLNKDYADMEDMDILREHYRHSKPHLNEEEISFLIDDSFSYDEETDEEREIRRKKLALKESIAEAKSNLTSLKSKYYDDLKLSSKLTVEQKEAVQFYDNYKQTEELSKQQRSVFEEKTNNLFTENFKGFDYKVGNNKYRFKVKDVDNVKNNQSDINSLVSRFVDNNNNMNDATGYHKALFTAMNADAIANHFYEQGRADAVKNSMAKSKNINMDPRGSHEKVTTTSGMQVKAVSGDDFERLRVKIKR
jgi:hypothetical protein